MSRIDLFIVLATLLSASPALAQEVSPANEAPTAAAEDENYDFSWTDWSVRTQLRPNQGWRFGGQALMSPVWFFAGILTHESSHALLGMVCGFRVDRFYPYPVIVPVQQTAEDEPQDTFYLGLTIFEPRPVDEIEDWQVALTTIAPFMMDSLMFLTGDLLLEYIVNPHSVGAPFMLVGLMMVPLADFIVGLFTLNEGGDLRQFSDAVGIPVGVSAGIGWGLAIVGLWRLAHQFRRVFFEPTAVAERRQREAAVSILPIAGEEMTGVGVAGRF